MASVVFNDLLIKEKFLSMPLLGTLQSGKTVHNSPIISHFYIQVYYANLLFGRAILTFSQSIRFPDSFNPDRIIMYEIRHHMWI